MSEPFSPLQRRIFKDILNAVTQYFVRRISLSELCYQLNTGIEELELADKELSQKLLDVWTSLEIVSSLGAEDSSVKQISADLERLKKIIEPLLDEHIPGNP